MDMKSILFPYDDIRPIQIDLIKSVKEALGSKTHLVAHAPTGLGKTAASLPIALKHAIDNKLIVFFLTSRHTQHKIAIDTLKDIRDKYDLDFVAVDLVGKKWMCAAPGADLLSSSEFTEYCKGQKEDEKCQYFSNTKSGMKLLPKAKHIFEELKSLGVIESDKVVEVASQENLCPYEMSLALAKDANVIIGDYFHIFNDTIRKNLFNKTDNEIGSCILIVDEGHNLPNRVRDLMSSKLSDFLLQRAIGEAKKFEYDEIRSYLEMLHDIFKNFEKKLEKEEMLVTKEEWINSIQLIKDYDALIADLHFIADDILEQRQKSYIFLVAQFLEAWKNDDKGFARIFSKKFGRKRAMLQLSFSCLDPSLVTRSVIENSYSTILMSGTLTPTKMYKDILGFPEETNQEIFDSPFPSENKLSMIVPKTTTKYTARCDDMYKQIAEACANITNLVPGNSAIFFPSYYLRDQVYNHFYNISKKTNLREESGITKLEKLELLERFKSYKDHGAVLLGVSSGSYGEGVDLPGDLLKCVVVVGLPLHKPDLETQQLIKYYDDIFGKGWDYGYLFPAFNKTLQSAGRCIRSEEDRGIVVFLDERYAWRNYYRCFPEDYGVIVAHEYEKYVEKFFED